MLPYLTEEVNPRAAAHMAQTSLDLLETEEYLEQQTDQLMERYASAEKNAVVLRDAVSSEAPLLQRYVIRRVLEQLAGKRKDLTREHLESVRELFEKQVGKSVCLPYGITAVRGYETLRLEKQGMHLKEERKMRRLSENWAVFAGTELLGRLYKILGEKNVKVVQKVIEKKGKVY